MGLIRELLAGLQDVGDEFDLFDDQPIDESPHNDGDDSALGGEVSRAPSSVH